MIRIGDIATPRQDHSNAGGKTGGKPKISDQTERAPKLGAGNAFLIGIKAAFKSITSDSSYATIRNELKKAIVQDKTEKSIAHGELRDSQKARAMKLDSSPSQLTAFTEQVANQTEDKMEKRAVTVPMIEKFLFPPAKDQQDQKSLMAFYSNMISRFKNEMLNKGNAPEDNLKNFKDLVAIAFPRVANLSVIGNIDPNIFQKVGQEFGKEFRHENKAFMDVLHNMMSGMKNPASEIAKTIKTLGQEEIRSEYHKLSGEGGGFIRDKGVDAFNLHILNNGGEKLKGAARNFMAPHEKNQNFKDLKSAIKSFEETSGTKANFKNGEFNKDGVTALGNMSRQIVQHVKANGINDDLKKVLGEIKDLLIQDVLDKKLSKKDAIEALRLFGDSTMVLRFVNPEVYGGAAGSSRELLALSQFLQLVTIGGQPKGEMPQDAKVEYNTQLGLIQADLRELVAAFGLPTLEEFGNQIDTALRNKNDGVEEMPGLKDPKELADLNTEMDDMETLDQIVEDEKIHVDPETAFYQKLSDKGLLPKDDGTDTFADILGETTPEQQKQLDEYNRIADLKIEELTNEVNELLDPKEKTTENKTN